MSDQKCHQHLKEKVHRFISETRSDPLSSDSSCNYNCNQYSTYNDKQKILIVNSGLHVGYEEIDPVLFDIVFCKIRSHLKAEAYGQETLLRTRYMRNRKLKN